MSAAKGTSGLCFRKFAGFSTRSVTLEIVRAARKCHEDDTWLCRSRGCVAERLRADNIPARWRVERLEIRPENTGRFHHSFGTLNRVVSFGRTNATWDAFVIFANPGWESREKPNQRAVMSHAFVTLIAVSMVLCASAAVTQSARDVRGPSPLIAIENEAPPKLIVDPPLPEPLSRGLVFIQYRTENLRIAPVFGKGALEVSPRVGHVHVTVDDVGWHFVDASSETLIVVGLKPGPHKVLIELAGPTHRVITSATVKFTLPGPKSPDSR